MPPGSSEQCPKMDLFVARWGLPAGCACHPRFPFMMCLCRLLYRAPHGFKMDKRCAGCAHRPPSVLLQGRSSVPNLGAP